MPIDRRGILNIAAAGVVAGVLPVGRESAADNLPKFRAIALDGFTTFDPRPVFALAEQLFPGRGSELGTAWRTRQFEYTWLRTLAGHYVDFRRVTEDALVFAAKLSKLELTAEKRERLMQAYGEISAWPDAPPALHALRAAGVRLAFLANFTADMLDAAVAKSRLAGIFEPHLSTDRVRAFKPDPRAYRMALAAFGLPKEEILFAAFGGWDAAGAKAFGYPTFWVNRAGLPVEELDFVPDGVGRDLGDLASFVLGQS